MSDDQSSWLSKMGEVLGITTDDSSAATEAISADASAAVDTAGTEDQEVQQAESGMVDAVQQAVANALASATDSDGDESGESEASSAQAEPDGDASDDTPSHAVGGSGVEEPDDGEGVKESGALLVTVCFEDGTDAAGAQVVVVGYGSSAVTDSSGRAYLSDVPTGDFTINASYGDITGEMQASSEMTQVGIILQGVPDEGEAPDFSPEALNADADKLRNASNSLRRAVATAEHFTHQLKSPEGAKGIAYQIAAGTLGLAAAGKQGYDAAKKKVKGVTDPITDPEGYARDKAQDAALDKKKEVDPSLKESGEKFGETAGTSVELMTGQLHQIYKNTRASYSAFQTATASFDTAYQGFINAVDMLGQIQGIGNMKARLGEMKEAALQYLMQCDIHGVRQKASQLAALDAAIQQAIGAMVTDATDALGPKTGLPKKIVEKAIE